MSTPARSRPRARTARSASSAISSDGEPGRRVAPSATFVRHSPGAATRATAPTTEPPATTTRRSQPSAGRSSCTSAPCLRNHERCASSPSSSSSSGFDSQRKTSWPQLPKRGLTTYGGASFRGNGRGQQMRRSRMRDAGAREQDRGGELVVRGEQRCGGVEHDPAALLEPREHPEAGLDPVERRQNVDPAEHEVDRRGSAASSGEAIAEANPARRARRPSARFVSDGLPTTSARPCDVATDRPARLDVF